MSESASHPAAPPDAPLAFARVLLGDLAIGIETRFVVRALPRPARLARLPRSHDAIDGVFLDGAHTVPVVDLRRWMAPGQSHDAAPSQVLVLGAGKRCIGLAIDAVQGLARVRPSQLRRIHQGEAEDDFFHSVAPDGDGELLSLLDPLRLMARVRAWSEAAADDVQAAPTGDAGAENSAGARQAHALVRIGGALLAVPAPLVAQVVARPTAQPVLGAGRELLGMIEWRARHLPLLDLAGMLGLPGLEAPLAMVLAQGEAQVALPIERVVAVRPLAARDVARDVAREVAPAMDAGLVHPLVRGVVLLDDGERVLLLDGEALLRTHAAPGLSRAPAGSGASLAARARLAGAHIVFDAGHRWAAPMDALEEILPLPEGLRAAGSGPMPTVAWRGRSLPLIDLREPDAEDGPQRLLVVRHQGRLAALRVNDVVELLPAQSGELLQFQAAGGARVRMITVGEANARISYPVLDLAALPFFAGA